MNAAVEITLGDVVRLRDGQTIKVESKYDWFEDAQGRHEGPFVATHSMDRFLLSEVVEVVAKNERLCVFCGEGVTSTNPETDFCRTCFYTGRASERALRPLLDRIDDIDEVSQNASVWHTGGGCFNLAVHLADGRLLTPSVGLRDDDGNVWPEPGFPDPDDPDARWSLVVSESEEAWSEWDESKLWIPQVLYTADELVQEIRDIAAKPDAVLARAFRDAEANDAPDIDAFVLATNDLLWRLGVPAIDREQGVTAKAYAQIDAFVRATLGEEQTS